jgi:lysophospholipase L1-like esterase
MNPSGCSQCAQRVVGLNQAITTWAASKNQTQSPITVVDCWTGFNDATDTIDGVHPNSSGNEKMATSWYGPLVAAIKSHS